MEKGIKELQKEIDDLKSTISRLVEFNDKLLWRLSNLPRKNNPFAIQIIMYEIIDNLIKKGKFKNGTSVVQIVEDMEKLIDSVNDESIIPFSVRNDILFEKEAFKDYKNIFEKDGDVFYTVYHYYGCFPPGEIIVQIKDDKLLDFKFGRQKITDDLDM